MESLLQVTFWISIFRRNLLFVYCFIANIVPFSPRLPISKFQMDNLEVPQPGTSYARDTSPSGHSDMSESSFDDNAEAVLTQKRRSRHLHGIWALLPALLRPKSKSQTDTAFDQWKAKERRAVTNLFILFISAVVLVV